MLHDILNVLLALVGILAAIAIITIIALVIVGLFYLVIAMFMGDDLP